MKFSFAGFRRHDGQVGIRNHIAVISTVTCANRIVQRIGFEDPEVVCIEQSAGCMSLDDDKVIAHDVLLGMARNPNVGAVCFVGLGCDKTPAKSLLAEVGGLKPAEAIAIQDCGGTEGAVAQCRAFIAEARKLLANDKRSPCELS